MRPWSCRHCSTVLGYVDRDERRIRPEPNVGIRWLARRYGIELTCSNPACGKKRTWQGELERPVSRFEVRGLMVSR